MSFGKSTDFATKRKKIFIEIVKEKPEFEIVKLWLSSQDYSYVGYTQETL